MVKILLVEDNRSKAHKILQTLTCVSGLSEEDVDIVPDIMAAKNALRSEQYDLLLLDIQVPIRFDQPPRKDGGILLLEALKAGEGKYYKPLYIIGITAYDDALSDATPAFANLLWAVIKYEENSDTWAKQILDKLQDLMEIKKVYQLPFEKSKDYIFDIAIICALPKTELESILDLPGNWKRIISSDESTVYYTGTFKTEGKEINVVAAASTQMGMPAAAVLATKLIYTFRPEYIVMTGIAAGVKDEVGLGDILVADPSWDYGAGKISTTDEGSAFLPEARQLRIPTEIKERLVHISLDRKLLDGIHLSYQHSKPDKPLSLYIGPVASGSAVVSNTAIVDKVVDQERKLIGLEMETYGVYLAAANCSKPRPTAFSIKSVCDFADKHKNDNVHKYAAYTSARLMYEFALAYTDYCPKNKGGIRSVEAELGLRAIGSH